MTAEPDGEYYARPGVVEKYETLRTRGLRVREKRALAEYLEPDSRILDIGCGAGRTTEALEERGFDVVAFDRSAPMVRATETTVEDTALAVGDAVRLPFGDDSFDFALFSYNGIDELHPESERYAALREIHRVLRPGGRFAFSTHNLFRQFVPFPPSLDSIAARIRFWLHVFRARRIGSRYKHDLSESEDPHLVYYADPLKQYQQLRSVDFDVLGFVGNGTPLATYFGAVVFVVAEVPPD